MRADSISFENFRNLKNNKIECHRSVNVIYGDNAQGKTNLLEAIWLFSGAKSFRGAKDSECVAHDKDIARLILDFESMGRSQTARLDISNRRVATLGGVSLKSAGELAGNFRAVVFSPTHLSLIKDGPQGRRRFLDTAIGQLWPKYISLLKDYTRCIAQRNALLRDVRFHSQLLDMLDIYDNELCTLGNRIAQYRSKYIELLSERSAIIYNGITSGKETLGVSYISSSGLSKDEMAQKLKSSRSDDINSGTTSIGPHRDEIEVTVNGMLARSFGSQGQQRSAVISLKMGEAEVINEQTGEEPVMLLDDVMSELDEGRQDYILNHIEHQQVFITCCDKSAVGLLKGGSTFLMQNGEIIDKT